MEEEKGKEGGVYDNEYIMERGRKEDVGVFKKSTGRECISV